MSIVLDALKTRNLEIKKECKDRELLMTKGRSDKKSWKGKEKSFRMNSKGEARKCFLCHKGHFKKNFPLNKSKEASSSKHVAETSEANVIDGYESGYDSVEVLMMSYRDIHDAWIMDSGCTFHMAPNWIFFINFQKSDEEKSYWVMMVPMKSGYTIKFENGIMKVTKGSLVKLRGTSRNDLYVLEGTAVSVCSDSIASDSKKHRKDAMEAELSILQKNQTWSLVTKPPIQKLIQPKWFKSEGDSKPRYKARLVAKVLPAHRIKYRSNELKVNSG
ncbi:Retrovirus-related Pol polyprotein from transposon TNT 1-94 [Cucumis melo var. makuwa]|uniref:Retrovirus-related Pol polyprotein from transposon TNT 1-94 n=1 Tax=Cucumis melo var. makuwa TaxID=1194695 RepID=A0A5A7U6F0_CUCMM|nr:Retrovirus-related Pol polyprotein from transposon TNT 1-94 [Cucumis melo var. makuwa]